MDYDATPTFIGIKKMFSVSIVLAVESAIENEDPLASSPIGTLRYRNADALKYVTVEERLGRVHGVGGGKIKLRSAANDATLVSIWLLLGKLESCCV